MTLVRGSPIAAPHAFYRKEENTRHDEYFITLESNQALCINDVTTILIVIPLSFGHQKEDQTEFK